MPNDVDVTVWFNEHRLNALCENGIDAENDLSGFLDSLYDQFVPEEEKEKIEAQIQTEQEEYDRYHEQNRHFSLMEIIENGVSCYCESENCTTLFGAASRFINALEIRNTQEKHFQGGLTDLAFGDCFETKSVYMQNYTGDYNSDPRVAFCAKINFDAKIISDWDVCCRSWTEYSAERLTDGIQTATKEQNLTAEQRASIFDDKINEGDAEFDEDILTRIWFQ